MSPSDWIRNGSVSRPVFAGLALITLFLELQVGILPGLAKDDRMASQGRFVPGKHGSGGAVPGGFQRKQPRRFPREGQDLGDFKWIAPGTFTMGSPAEDQDASFREVPAHTVILTRGFWMCDHEVTQAEYLAVMKSSPSTFKGPDRPVENVSWFDAVAYCERLTDQEVKAGRIPRRYEYRLPTEAEWEYACRAGTTGPRYGELDPIAWWEGNSGGKTHPVRQKQPNALGLYDMLGNVDEWVADWLADYGTETVTDPVGPLVGEQRVIRGGSYFVDAMIVRPASRGASPPDVTFDDTGFRVVLSEVR
jgi:formylglycine-generating enzyme required for sulfatase activity